MASLGCTVLDRITSEISRLSAISSLDSVSRRNTNTASVGVDTYKLDEVARSICSSSALVVEDPNQPAMMLPNALGAARKRG